MRLISVIIPSRERPAQAVRCVERLLHTTRGYEVEPVLVADGCQATAAAFVQMAECYPQVQVLAPEARQFAIRAWNLGASQAAGDVLVLGADDLWWYHGWLGEVLDRLDDFPNGDGMVGINDLGRDGNALSTHFAVSRRFCVEHLGGCLLTPVYRHFFCDNEANERAKRAQRFVWAYNAVAEHRHPAFDKGKLDPVYQSVQGWLDEDRQRFLARQQAGFPDDFEAVVR